MITAPENQPYRPIQRQAPERIPNPELVTTREPDGTITLAIGTVVLGLTAEQARSLAARLVYLAKGG